MKEKHTHNKILEQRIYNLIREDDENDAVANFVDILLMILIIISVIVAFLGTFEFASTFKQSLDMFETVFVILFTIEYIIRLWTSELMYPKLPSWRARIRYVFSPMALVDLLSILPFYLPFFGIQVGVLRVIKLVRLLRIFKINRYTNSLGLIGRVLRTRATQLLSSILVIFILIFIASMLMFDIEHVAQPDKFNNALSAMWWAMSTITTVGYGDIYPITTLGRVLSAVITFLGIGLTAIPTGIISAGFIEQSQIAARQKKMTKHKDRHYCPHCGENLKDIF